MKLAAENEDGTPAEIVLSEVYSGVGIKTDMGLFGIAQRDGGIEVMFNGKTVWTSHELDETDESERLVPGECVSDVLASGLMTSDPSASLSGVCLPDGSGAFVGSLEPTGLSQIGHRKVGEGSAIIGALSGDSLVCSSVFVVRERS